MSRDNDLVFASRNPIYHLLLWIGLIRIRDGRVRWPFHSDPWWIWKIRFRHPSQKSIGGWFGVFRNRPGVIKWEEDRLLPRRWGFRILGFEFGDRG